MVVLTIYDRSKPIGSIETIRWLKKRFDGKIQEPYTMTEKEHKQYEDIKNVFHNFDFDGSRKQLHF